MIFLIYLFGNVFKPFPDEQRKPIRVKFHNRLAYISIWYNIVYHFFQFSHIPAVLTIYNLDICIQNNLNHSLSSKKYFLLLFGYKRIQKTDELYDNSFYKVTCVVIHHVTRI